MELLLPFMLIIIGICIFETMVQMIQIAGHPVMSRFVYAGEFIILGVFFPRIAAVFAVISVLMWLRRTVKLKITARTIK